MQDERRRVKWQRFPSKQPGYVDEVADTLHRINSSLTPGYLEASAYRQRQSISFENLPGDAKLGRRVTGKLCHKLPNFPSNVFGTNNRQQDCRGTSSSTSYQTRFASIETGRL